MRDPEMESFLVILFPDGWIAPVKFRMLGSGVNTGSHDYNIVVIKLFVTTC